MHAYMTLLFILVTLAHFHFVLVVETVPYSGALPVQAIFTGKIFYM
jgi:hypothetical protein